jgi:hypothetical protein
MTHSPCIVCGRRRGDRHAQLCNACAESVCRLQRMSPEELCRVRDRLDLLEARYGYAVAAPVHSSAGGLHKRGELG